LAARIKSFNSLKVQEFELVDRAEGIEIILHVIEVEVPISDLLIPNGILDQVSGSFES